MEGLGPIAIFLGGLALFVGFCGVWLASFALRKIDSQINEFLKGPVQRLREGISEVNDRVASTQSDLELLKRQSKDALGALHRDLELHRTNTAQIHRNVTDLVEKVNQLAAAAGQARRPLQAGRPPEAPVQTKQAG